MFDPNKLKAFNEQQLSEHENNWDYLGKRLTQKGFDLDALVDEEGFPQKAYLEFHDDKLDFKPNFRRITIYTYHPKWIPMPEGSEPIGYEVAYQLSREFKRDIYEKMDSQKNAYVDVVRP